MLDWRTTLFANFFTFNAHHNPMPLKIFKRILVLLLMFCAGTGFCQKQLVLLKKENVLLRLYPGDEFIYRLKGSNTIRTTYVNNLSDTAVVTHRDTVAFHRIDRVYFRQHKFYNTVGTALVIFGGGLFVIDQLNTGVIQHQPLSLDDGVTALSAASVAAGLPMMLIKKKSQKIGFRTRLMTVDKGSAFFRPDTREQIN